MTAFQRSETTEQIVKYLREHPKDSRVPYAELTELVGTTITSRTTHLISARRILERDHAQVWTCIQPCIGVARLNDAEIADRHRNWFLSGAKNRLSAGARQADVVELEQLDLTQQARFATDSIIREIASESLARATRRKIERVSRGSGNDLPSFNAVEWMISLSPRRSAA